MVKNDFEIREGVTAIFLRRKDGTVLETIIDTIDLPKAREFVNTWYARSYNEKFTYAVGNTQYKNGKKTTVILHRWLYENLSGIIDHINHKTLDNRRSVNLREVNCSENSLNRKGASTNSRSGIRGVSWNKRDKRWRAQIMIKGQKIYLGNFKDKNIAAQAVRDVIKELSI